MGFVGSGHLQELADSALNAATHAAEGQRSHLVAMALKAAQAAWEWDLFDAPAANRFADLAAQQATHLDAASSAMASLAREMAQTWVPPKSPAYLQRLVQRDEPERLMGYIENECAREPANFFWWQQAVRAAGNSAMHDRLLDLLSRAWSLGDGPFLQAARAEALLGLGQVEPASRFFLQAHTSLPGHVLLAKAARSLHLAGDDEQARRMTAQALQDAPWNANLTLALHDALTSAGSRRSTLHGRIAVCLYSFNRASLLDETLGSLFGSELFGATVHVLNNGSMDGTASVLASWRERVGERLQPVPLPVNVGAPVARNWLKALPGVRDADWVAFLDDDVILPMDWLARLAASTEAYPEAGAWGAKVVDGRSPHVLQNADVQVKIVAQGEDLILREGDLHFQVQDAGLLDYARPCAHVMGCCHLLRGSVLRSAGDFDLRFSPTQFGDLDYNLRLCLAGRPPVYCGHLDVLHKKPVTKAAARTSGEQITLQAALVKLQNKYEPGELETLRRKLFATLEHDLAVKADRLDGLGYGLREEEA